MKDKITYRKINVQDKLFIFNLSNEKNVRENSFMSKEISFDEHSSWFDSKIKDDSAFYLIFMYKNTDMCFIRFDKKDEVSTIGINLDKNYRGKGFASIILEQACKIYLKNYKQVIKAYIKTTNVASIKSFEKANFTFVKELKINNFDSVEYKYNNL